MDRNLCGIYRIYCKENARFYVGSAVSIRTRWQAHKTKLKGQCHRNKKLQNAWNKYGPDSFEFSVLEYVPEKEKLIEREQHWIDELEAAGPHGFNLSTTAGSLLGFKHTEETKRRLSEARKGVPKPDHIRENLRVANINRVYTEEHRAALTRAAIGRKRSTQSVEASAAAHRGRKHSEESKRLISEALRGKQSWLGRKHSPEAIQKMRDAKKGHGKGKTISVETRIKISLATKGKSKTRRLNIPNKSTEREADHAVQE